MRSDIRIGLIVCAIVLLLAIVLFQLNVLDSQLVFNIFIVPVFIGNLILIFRVYRANKKVR
ncbi:hypothetical protein [Robertkochia sediminum]|uniref:hypothetical protein n=1 Tax=Robertkochia sediminum TaxID=2785326 RepID=UPI001932B6BE|nr:hypothetical protein [Robertkochia sediminum]MBL7472044.1 hypothetical protein [Robertkochia sediminum]